VDAVGIVVGAGGIFLLYCAYKGEHPWTLFLQVLGANSTPTASAGTTVKMVDTGGNIQPVATPIAPNVSVAGSPGINDLGGSTTGVSGPVAG
jgi:hypothetical protein